MFRDLEVQMSSLELLQELRAGRPSSFLSSHDKQSMMNVVGRDTPLCQRSPRTIVSELSNEFSDSVMRKQSPDTQWQGLPTSGVDKEESSQVSSL
jgi:hypothetical protein